MSRAELPPTVETAPSPGGGTKRSVWTQCFLAYLDERAKYPPGHRFHPGDYEGFLLRWYNDFCND